MDNHNSKINIEVDAKKATIKEEEAWDLVKDADKIHIASGKKILLFTPDTDNKQAIMTKMLGRTGNLRAPAIRKGNTFFIGFNEQMYTTVLFS